MKLKLSGILDMTGYGDWMMYLLLAKNTDRVIFTQIMEAQNYPDYDYDAEPLDHVNKRINNRHEINSDEKVKSDPEKKRFLNKV